MRAGLREGREVNWVAGTAVAGGKVGCGAVSARRIVFFGSARRKGKQRWIGRSEALLQRLSYWRTERKFGKDKQSHRGGGMFAWNGKKR